MKPQYFSHDCGARNDPKLQRLQIKRGMFGLGLYWCIVELLFECEGKINKSDLDIYSYALKVTEDDMIDILNNYGLFEQNEKYYWSISANKRLEKMKSKADQAKDAATTRWEKRNINARDL